MPVWEFLKNKKIIFLSGRQKSVGKGMSETDVPYPNSVNAF